MGILHVMDSKIGRLELEYTRVCHSYNNVIVGVIRTNLGDEKTCAKVRNTLNIIRNLIDKRC